VNYAYSDICFFYTRRRAGFVLLLEDKNLRRISKMKKKVKELDDCVRKLEAIKRKKIKNGEWRDFPPLLFRLKGGALK
jgi:hypothetical protein